MLPVLESREDGLSPPSQQEWFEVVEGQVNSENEVEKARRERSRTADHAMRLLMLEFYTHQLGLSVSSTLCVMENGKLFELSTVKQLCFTDSELPLVSATPREETAHPV